MDAMGWRWWAGRSDGGLIFRFIDLCIFHVPDIVRWGSVLFDLFDRALYEDHGIQKV